MFRVGLTGGLASGKSTVRRRFADAGFFAIDADELVAALYEPGGRGTAVIADLLGEEFLDASGAVDRPKVAARVFAEAELRSALEERIHPLVRAVFTEAATASDADVAVLEATLLVEAGYRPDFDLIVTVEADRATQLERAVERGLSPDQAEARLAAQGTGDARRAAADRTIRNDGTLAELHAAVDALVREIRVLAESDA